MSAGGEAGKIARWSCDQLRTQRAQRGDLLIVDVRTLDARQLSPYGIPGARWSPLADVAVRSGGLPRDATIITYCT